jgi:hypothetical protein
MFQELQTRQLLNLLHRVVRHQYFVVVPTMLMMQNLLLRALKMKLGSDCCFLFERRRHPLKKTNQEGLLR